MATMTPNSSAFAAQPALTSAPVMRPAGATARGGAVARYEPRLRALLSLRPWRTEVVIIIAYLVVTRVGALSAAKAGFEFGPVPMFLTDITLFALIGFAFILRPARFLFWASSGTQAGSIGFAVWILCALAVIYFLMAFPTYRIYAVRDLAIFAYSLFLPLTYFAISNRTVAVRATRYFIYSGAVVAVLILVQAASGLNLGFGIGQRIVLGQAIDYVGGDDYGGVLAFSLAGLSALLLFERRRRGFHIAAALLCFLALAENGSRSAFVGLALAGMVTFLLVAHRYRFGFMLFAAVLASVLILGQLLPDSIPGVAILHRFDIAILSATRGQADPNAAFRLVRWEDAIDTWRLSPVLGVGFGSNILHRLYIGEWSPDKFNLGMPHNTFLFLLARMGLPGLGLIGFAWGLGLWRLARAVRRGRGPDELAVLNILIAMAGFAAFVLFFERPMNNASFWIMLAVGMRLAETAHGPAFVPSWSPSQPPADMLRARASFLATAPMSASRNDPFSQ
jgi:O-antigen ligase